MFRHISCRILWQEVRAGQPLRALFLPFAAEGASFCPTCRIYIVKILGDDHDDPAPDRVEQPEAGAEFDVYLKSAGSYENARPFERDHLVTNKRGYAKTKALPYGIYVLEQTKGKEGYEIKGAIEFEIDGTEDIQNPPPLTLSDRPILYRLRKTILAIGKELFITKRQAQRRVNEAVIEFQNLLNEQEIQAREK